MDSDFVDSYLKLTTEEHAVASASDPDFPQTARVTLEYGAEKKGYY